MSSMIPNFTSWLETAWGAGQEWSSVGNWPGAGNLIPGGSSGNPAYTLDDFYSIYPAFFGSAIAIAGCTTMMGSQTVGVPSVTGLACGQFVRAVGSLPPGSVITGVGINSITVNQAAVVTGSATLSIYESPLVPMIVVKTYLNLAYASLQQARWQDTWWLAMGLYIAHYCQLYLDSTPSSVATMLQESLHGEAPVAVPGDLTSKLFTISSAPSGGTVTLYEGGEFLVPTTDYTLVGVDLALTDALPPAATLYAQWPVQSSIPVSSGSPAAAQVAAAGIANGIMTSKSVGDVSASYTILESLKDWGAWQLTKFGQQLATLAKAIGAGPLVIW